MPGFRIRRQDQYRTHVTHTTSMAPGSVGLLGFFFLYLSKDVPTTIGWITVKFVVDTPVTPRMNRNTFSNLLTLNLQHDNQTTTTLIPIGFGLTLFSMLNFMLSVLHGEHCRHCETSTHERHCYYISMLMLSSFTNRLVHQHGDLSSSKRHCFTELVELQSHDSPQNSSCTHVIRRQLLKKEKEKLTTEILLRTQKVTDTDVYYNVRIAWSLFPLCCQFLRRICSSNCFNHFSEFADICDLSFHDFIITLLSSYNHCRKYLQRYFPMRDLTSQRHSH